MTTPNFSGETSAGLDRNSTKPSRWLQIALASSLAINLGIAGVVAGAMFRSGGPMKEGVVVRDVGFGPFTEALSKEDRGALRLAFLKKMPQMRDARRVMRADFTEVLTQLRAVPLDAEGLRQILDRQTSRNIGRLQLGQSLIFEMVVGMTDDARQGFADRLEKIVSREQKHRDGPIVP